MEEVSPILNHTNPELVEHAKALHGLTPNPEVPTGFTEASDPTSTSSANQRRSFEARLASSDRIPAEREISWEIAPTPTQKIAGTQIQTDPSRTPQHHVSSRYRKEANGGVVEAIGRGL